MKKSFMSNIKNFVDSNVRQRIDRVAHNYSEPLSDDLLAVERHFEDIRQVCIDADKKISALLQSIQLASNPSHLSAYTQNVQAGITSLSHNISLQAANIATSGSSSTATNSSQLKPGETNPKNSQQVAISEGTPATCNSNQQYRSSESLSDRSNTLTNSHDSIASHAALESSCQPAEQLSEEVQQRYKKLPVVGFYKFLVKSSQKLKQDSLLANTLSQCSQLQIQLTNLYLAYERLVDTQCLKPIQQILETDIPTVIRLKKLYIKSHNDYEFLKTKYNVATLKQQQQQQQQQQNPTAQPGHATNTSYLVSQNSVQQAYSNKLDQLKNELDEAVTRFEQARDTYEAELYGFVCRETELVNLLRTFYRYQAEYHKQVGTVMQGLLPSLSESLAQTPRKSAFGTELAEHLRCTGREISPVIELCIHFLHMQGCTEEGLFRIPGSSVRIKKLKNGINAWFLSLASLSELLSDQKQSGRHCITALYELFSDAIAQSVHQAPTQPQAVAASTTASNSVLKSTLAVDESVLNQINYNHDCGDIEEMIFDVHSVAGLLKLYLRELPEPLCTYTLYDDWVRCVDNQLDNETKIKMLKAVIDRLPPAYRANLEHLIKFLHLLTQHQEQNKMTSTNLAIAMAPSLFWPKQDAVAEQQCDSASQTDDVHSLQAQMSTFGLSASHHAMILEALINNSDVLFSNSCDFNLAGFESLRLKANKNQSSGRSRSVKSTSPTGLSTTSSSSFSSNASNLAASSAVKGHSRKGGSMEGLLNVSQDANVPIQQHHSSSIRSANRPVSVQIRREEYSIAVQPSDQKPPSKPPIPILRSQSKQTSCDERSQPGATPIRSHNKPPAPPVPPPTTKRHEIERMKAANANNSALVDHTPSQKPRPISLRGTGTIEQAGANPINNHQHVLRPSVPPPERPKSIESSRTEVDEIVSSDTAQVDGITGVTLAATNGSVQPNTEVDESLNEASDNANSLDADSSFESRHSLDSPPLTCGTSTIKLSNDIDDDTNDHAKGDTLKAETKEDRESEVKSKPALERRPPVKPPRSTSPKISQSTPL